MNDTIEATDLYAMVFSEDCKCTSPHNLEWNSECSFEVTHYRANCVYRGLICGNAASQMLEWLSVPGRCASCGSQIQDCWKVVAI